MKNKSGGLFDEQFRLEKISKQNDPLEKLRAHIDSMPIKITSKLTLFTDQPI